MIFSLSTLAFYACSEAHRDWYETNVPETMRKEVRALERCCVLLLNTVLQRDRQHDDRLEDMQPRERRAWRLRAVRHGHADCARAIGAVGGGLPGDDRLLCPEAAAYGHADTLRRLHEAGFPWDEDTTAAAAHNGSLETLRYAREHGCAWNYRTCVEAARHADTACLRYARQNGCEWDEMVTCTAAAAGSVACLEFAHRDGCPWHPSTCVAAALTGHLQCLAYAAEHGSPMDYEVCLAAVEGGNAQCVEYVLRRFERDVGAPRADWRAIIDAARADRERRALQPDGSGSSDDEL